MKKILAFTLVLLIASIAALGAVIYWKYFRGIWPIIKPPPQFTPILPSPLSKIAPSAGSTPSPLPKNTTGMPLKIPDGFSISIFAKDLGGPRVLTFDPTGKILVSIPSQGKILRIYDADNDGFGETVNTVISGLNRPHGIAFNCAETPCKLYIAETDKVAAYDYDENLGIAKNKTILAELPGSGRHFTRTIGFGPDGRLYVSIGSSCDVCIENDTRRAAIFSMDKDGSDFHKFAGGLRNAVFFAWHPLTKDLWATEMGRDYLGDNLPPDEINIVKNGNDYGWPICYGKNIHDTNFDRNVYVRDPCASKTPSYIDIPAHSSPLGLAFIPADSKWPREYWNNLLVAFHGSWNRTVPTGYKVVRYKLDENGNPPADVSSEDFITGWLTSSGEIIGRPVDILVKPHGVIYISDDRAGVIYRVSYSTGS